jgi:hypothetical protein
MLKTSYFLEEVKCHALISYPNASDHGRNSHEVQRSEALCCLHQVPDKRADTKIKGSDPLLN